MKTRDASADTHDRQGDNKPSPIHAAWNETLAKTKKIHISSPQVI